MPEISRFYGIIIRMYFQDHNPPYFHADYHGNKAEYAIDSLKCLAGSLPSRANALVLEWASIHRDELMKNWELSALPVSLNNIAPQD